MDISESLFETAIQDLNSVEVLYNAKHYNLALFQLQQSVEKFVKSFGIKTLLQRIWAIGLMENSLYLANPNNELNLVPNPL